MTTTSSEALTLEELKVRAVETLSARGWTTGTMEAADGKVCLHGAIRICSPQLGDNAIIELLARANGFTEEWNDDVVVERLLAQGYSSSADERRYRSEGAEVVAGALLALDVSDAALERALGQNWKEVVDAIRALATRLQADDIILSSSPLTGALEVDLHARLFAATVQRDLPGLRNLGTAVDDVVDMSSGYQSWPDTMRTSGALRAIALNGLIEDFSAEEYELATASWTEHIGPVPAYRKAGS